MAKGYAKKKDGKISKNLKKAVTKIVKNQIEDNQEWKQFSTNDAGLQPCYSNAGRRLYDMTSPASGLLDSNRVGDEITLKSLKVMIEAVNGTGANSYQNVNWRVIVFQYKSQDNAPTQQELFVPTANNFPSPAVGTFSAFNIDYKNVYNVLYDKIFRTTGTNGLAATAAQSTHSSNLLRFSVPLKYAKKKIQFEAGTQNTINGIWIMVITDKDSVAVNPQCKIESICRYTDS